MKRKLTIPGVLMVLLWLVLLVPSINGYLSGQSISKFYEDYLFGSCINPSCTLGLFFIVIFCLYGLSIKKSYHHSSNSKEVLIWAGIFTCILIFMFPFTCQDVYYYIATGRLHSYYQVNSYLTTATQIPGWQSDPFLSTSGWGFLVNVYGPIWTDFCLWLVSLASNNLWLALLLFKLLAGFVHIMNTILIGLTASRYKLGSVQAMVVYGWNPLLLFELPGHAHNDALVLTFVILAFYALSYGQGVLSIPCLTLASLVKYTPVILIPLFSVWLLINHRLKGLIAALFLSLITLLVFWYPYWEGTATLKGLFRQMNFYSIKSLHYLIYNFLQKLWPQFPKKIVFETVSQVLIATFLVIFLYLMIKLLTSNPLTSFDLLTTYCLVATILYLFIANKWFQPWYISWVIPLAALIRLPIPLPVTAIFLSFSAEMSRIPQMAFKNTDMAMQLCTFIIVWSPLVLYFWLKKRQLV